MASRKAFGRVSGILNSLPHVHHQEPLLRVHLLGFAGRNAEELRIKHFNPLSYHPGPFDVRFVRLCCCRVAEYGLPIPTRGWYFANAVAPFVQIVP